MLLRLCQLKSLTLVLLFLSACSGWKKQKSGEGELLPLLKGEWFQSNQEHALLDSQGNPQPHLFFDVDPEFGGKTPVVNTVITTPSKSPHHYLLDLNSGQRFYGHSYCKQKDIWDQQSGTFGAPDFSVGYIPRALDQLGTPQKVIIFGDPERVKRTLSVNYFRTRLVGAYVEQNCPEGNCHGKGNWLSRLVFIGVLVDDVTLNKVQDLKSFQEGRDWGAIKATLENMEGRNFVGGGFYPYIKVGELIEVNEAYDYFKKRSIIFTSAEMNKVRNGCHILYERMWQEVGQERPEDRSARTPQEYEEREKIRKELRRKEMPAGFAERFASFTRKYFDEVSTCEKFVYHGNINLNPEKFWFLSQMGIFYRLHKEGYYFDCRQKSWQRNILNNRGQPVYDLKSKVGECSEVAIDLAMTYLPNFLIGLKSNAPTFYKFIDYDNHSFGTHSKLYSWVRVSTKKFQCSSDRNEKFLEATAVFPEEVKWKERAVKDAPGMKIIY